jgi:hypothetical protein
MPSRQREGSLIDEMLDTIFDVGREYPPIGLALAATFYLSLAKILACHPASNEHSAKLFERAAAGHQL